ncbi:MerR family transcriptional regulator [Streptomyces rimosus]|uniref:hypothetical protein n=1 Tax=Streptomyces rimosus TaxID=1927 RepID=UPI0006B26ACC|nr:hypothetical protein [Streptomyces rimosus]
MRRIRCLLTAGLSTVVIAQVLPCLTDGESAAGLAPACPELVGHLRKERARMREKITTLYSSRAMLDAILLAGNGSSE